MEIDKLPIPEIVVDAFCRMVDMLDPKQLMAQGDGAIFQGHRVILKNVPVAQKHLKAMLKSNRNLDPLTRTMLQSDALFMGIVAALSEAALKCAFADLAAYYGEADFLAAALLDEREAVRKSAHNFIAEWNRERSDDTQRGKAAERISSELGPLLDHLRKLRGESQSSGSSVDNKHWLAERSKLQKELDAAKAVVTRVAKKGSDQWDSERKKLQEKIDQKQKEIDQLRSELVAARSDVASQKVTLSSCQSDLAELQASLGRSIEDGVNKALSGRLRRWLAPVRNVEDAVVGTQQSDLMTRSAQALMAQRSVDSHYRNRAALTRMIEERRQMLAEVQEARLNALNPLPELTSIAAELEREISDLAQHLGNPVEQTSATVSGLLAKINAVPSLDELSEVRQFIQETAAYELLGRDELHRLFRATDDKACLLYDKANLDTSGKDRTHPPTTRFFLRHAIAQEQPFTLFIDGHNILHALKDIFGRHFADGSPGHKARLELGNCLTRIFVKPGANVMLFFDSNDAAQQSLSDQVRIIYSGGTGAHRADEAILKQLLFYVHAKSSAPLCLVTEDADFAREAKTIGAIIIHPEEFAISIDLAEA